MDETGLFALALERHILAHVDRLAVETLAAQRLHEGADDRRPARAVHRECADIDVGRDILRRRHCFRPFAPVVVAVDVDKDETAVTFLDIGKDALELAVERVVKGERLIHNVLGRWLSPYVQAPGMVRRPIDRSRSRAVQIDLKARSMNDDLGWEIGDKVLGEGVLLPLPVRVGDAQERLASAPDVGAAMDRRANNGGITELDCPACR